MDRIVVTERQRAFTLIEILVVIAIIGILASVVLASLNSSKVKTRLSVAQDAMKNYQLGLQLCAQEGQIVTPPTASRDGGGVPMCVGGPNYVRLPSGWNYTAASNQTQIVAAGDDKIVTCTAESCTTN